jgi:hypothetical protein
MIFCDLLCFFKTASGVICPVLESSGGKINFHSLGGDVSSPHRLGEVDFSKKNPCHYYHCCNFATMGGGNDVLALFFILHLDIGTQLKVSLNCVAFPWAGLQNLNRREHR